MRTVTTVTLGLAMAFAVPATAQHPSLSISRVDGQTINCLFSTQCTINPTDLFADISFQRLCAVPR
jgi:hypothetical protein